VVKCYERFGYMNAAAAAAALGSSMTVWRTHDAMIFIGSTSQNSSPIDCASDVSALSVVVSWMCLSSADNLRYGILNYFSFVCAAAVAWNSLPDSLKYTALSLSRSRITLKHFSSLDTTHSAR